MKGEASPTTGEASSGTGEASPMSDAGLIARVLSRGDQHAFRQLVLRYQSPVRRWGRRLCKGDEAAGDDLAQEVFIKAHRSLRQYRGEARFSTWLYRIAFNLAASRRRLVREQWEAVEWDEHGEQALQARQGCSDSMASDMRRDLDAALAGLSEAQQITLRLSLEEGMSHEEIASIMALPLGTVKTHLLRGKQKLRQQLAPWREAL